MPNPERKYALISLVAAIVAVLLIFLPAWLGMDGMDGGYALSFVTTWIAISGLVIAWFFWRRATQLDELLRGQNLLAHWTYSQDEWRTFVGDELKQQTRENTGLLIIMAVMCLAMGILFWLVDREAGFIVFLVMIALIFILAMATFGIPWLTRMSRDRKVGEAWISDKAVYFDDVFYPFKSGLMGLTSVELSQPDTSANPSLDFHIYHLAYSIIQSRILRVPIPKEKIEEATELLRHFQTSKKQPGKENRS